MPHSIIVQLYSYVMDPISARKGCRWMFPRFREHAEWYPFWF